MIFFVGFCFSYDFVAYCDQGEGSAAAAAERYPIRDAVSEASRIYVSIEI